MLSFSIYKVISITYINFIIDFTNNSINTVNTADTVITMNNKEYSKSSSNMCIGNNNSFKLKFAYLKLHIFLNV